jgi:hypothetical protein
MSRINAGKNKFFVKVSTMKSKIIINIPRDKHEEVLKNFKGKTVAVSSICIAESVNNGEHEQARHRHHSKY